MGDVRCPVNERRRFLRVTDDGLIEVACRDCRVAERLKDPNVYQVVHLYQPDGTFRATQVHRIREAPPVLAGDRGLRK